MLGLLGDRLSMHRLTYFLGISVAGDGHCTVACGTGNLESLSLLCLMELVSCGMWLGGHRSCFEPIVLDVYVYGRSWTSMDIHGHPWASKDIQGYPRLSMDIHGYS